MGYFEDYQKRMNAGGSSYKELLTNNSKNAFENNFSNSPNYKIVQINSVETGAIIISDNTDIYKIITKEDCGINRGDIVSFASEVFLVTTPSKLNNMVYNVALMRQCNLNPFYFKENNITQTTYGYYEKNMSLDTDLDQLINLPDDTTLITIPAIDSIKNGDSFYIFSDDWYEKYEIKGLDRSKEGLLKIKAIEVQSDETPKEFYNLSPTSDTIGSVVVSLNSITLVINETKQLNATVFDPNGDIMVDEFVTWSSSNTSVATVDSTGRVLARAVGECTIVATSITSPNIYGSCMVEISSDSGWF